VFNLVATPVRFGLDNCGVNIWFEFVPTDKYGWSEPPSGGISEFAPLPL
jgi:hypothetical protein